MMDYQAMNPWAPENILEEVSIYTTHEQMVAYMKSKRKRNACLVERTSLFVAMSPQTLMVLFVISTPHSLKGSFFVYHCATLKRNFSHR